MRPEIRQKTPKTPSETEAVSKPQLEIALDCSALSVRASLAELRRRLGELLIDIETASAVELVLAEVMNNIHEHAYGGGSGLIELKVWVGADRLCFETRDAGVEMPGGAAPVGCPVVVDCAIEDMPEGGFGWYLIRQLTEDLNYARINGRNHLRFRMRRQP